jgi:hypothetical protein
MAFLPALAAIASIGAAGTTVGLDIANAGGGGGTPSAVAPPAPTPAQQAQTALQQREIAGQQIPTEEGLTSGFLSPAGYGQESALASGIAGQPGGNAAALAAALQSFGLPPSIIAYLNSGGGTPAATPAKFTPSGSGATNQGAFPTGTSQLSEFVNTFFRG